MAFIIGIFQLHCKSKHIQVKWNKLTVAIKRLMWEFNLYQKLICIDKNNHKKKTESPSLTSSPVPVFLIAEKLLKPMTLKFSDFQFVLTVINGCY